MSLLERLRPTPREIEQLALRETDPARCAEFEPITSGPLAALALLAFVGFAALLVTPFRLAARFFRRAE